MPSIKDFQNYELVIAQIKEVKDHPNADKLYLITVSTGEAEKTIVAGIKPFYKKEELEGKSVVIIDNLEPATIRGAVSNGMILATKDGESLAVLVPEKPVKIGSPVS